MKICVIGVTGQVGKSLINRIASLSYEVFSISRNEWDMNIDPSSGYNIIHNISPDLVINLAAYTDVERAEDENYMAMNINVEAPRSIATACHDLEIPIINLSSDYVFNGKTTQPYKSTDKPDPINFYGKSKYLGELAIMSATPRYIIIRTSWIFSKEIQSFPMKLLTKASTKNSIQVVNDQFGGPTSADCLADMLVKLIPKIFDGSFNYGVYHFSGKPITSWFLFAKKLMSIYEKRGLIDKVQISQCESSEYESKVSRPMFTMLETDQSILDLKVNCDWEKEILRIF